MRYGPINSMNPFRDPRFLSAAGAMAAPYMYGIGKQAMRLYNKMPPSPAPSGGGRGKPYVFPVRGTKGSTGFGLQGATSAIKKQRTRAAPPHRKYLLNTKAAGFFAKGRKKNTTKISRKTVNKSVSVTREIGFEVADNNVAFIGHANMPIKIVYRYAWMCIIKALAIRSGRKVRQLDNIVFTDNDQIQVLFKVNAGAPQLSETLVVNAGQNTVEEVGNFFASSGRPFNTTGSNASQVEMIEIRYLPFDNATTSNQQQHRHAVIDLQSFYLDIYSKSTLKIQNRTVLAADDTIEEVDTQPLYGKFYQGSANGTRFIDPELFTAGAGLLVADDEGVFKTQVPLDEPPLPSSLKDVKKYGKAMLNSGQLKTSSLTGRRTVRVDLLVHLFNESEGVAFARASLGDYRFFAFEKMIQVFTSELAINLAGEVNHFFSISYHTRTNNATQRLFEQSRT